MNVLFVINDLYNQVSLLFTAEFTVERNHTNVKSVTRHLVSWEVKTFTRESIQETNHTSVHCVIKVSVIAAIWRDTNAWYTAIEVLMTVATVGSCLKFIVI